MVGSDYTAITVAASHEAGGGVSQLGLMMQFDDIDPDEGTMVQHDRADWFMQRMLFNGWAWVQRNGVGTFAMRQLQLLIGTFRNEAVLSFVDPTGPNPSEPLSPLGYDITNRIIQTATGITGTHDNIPQVGYVTTSPNGYSRTDNTNAGAFSVTESQLGGRLHFGFDVKAKVGLRPDQGLHLLIGGVADNLRFPTLSLQADEQVHIEYTYQFLLQKRR